MTQLRITVVVGARPQFIKTAALSRAIERWNERGLRPRIEESLVHTGQHYDYEMSAVFFRELGLPEPRYHLGVGSGPHGAQTGEMLKGVEAVLRDTECDLVIVHGDTNSTLAGALAAAKLGVPIAHVEAGLRSFNRRMPEEVNRVIADHLSTWLLCPSESAQRNLAREGICEGARVTGDVMQDVLLWHLPRARERRELLTRLEIEERRFGLATIHRAEATDERGRLESLFAALETLARDHFPIVLPLHPRTKRALEEARIPVRKVQLIPPVSYEEMVLLEATAKVVLTDSGGVQKEAYWLGTPCVTLREETEWVETVEAGWNSLAGCDERKILDAALRETPTRSRLPLYGDGRAADEILRVICGGATE